MPVRKEKVEKTPITTLLFESEEDSDRGDNVSEISDQNDDDDNNNDEAGAVATGNLRKVKLTMIRMIVEAIKVIGGKHGASVQAIKKYITSNYDVNQDKLTVLMKKAINKGMTDGSIIRPKQYQAMESRLVGYFHLPVASKKSTLKGKSTAKAEKKPAKPKNIPLPKETKKTKKEQDDGEIVKGKKTVVKKAVEPEEEKPVKEEKPTKKKQDKAVKEDKPTKEKQDKPTKEKQDKPIKEKQDKPVKEKPDKPVKEKLAKNKPKSIAQKKGLRSNKEVPEPKVEESSDQDFVDQTSKPAVIVQELETTKKRQKKKPLKRTFPYAGSDTEATFLVPDRHSIRLYLSDTELEFTAPLEAVEDKKPNKNSKRKPKK